MMHVYSDTADAAPAEPYGAIDYSASAITPTIFKLTHGAILAWMHSQSQYTGSFLYPVKDPVLECLIALSTALDMANGLSDDKSVLTATFGAELALSLGCSEAVQASVFHAGLLRQMGCTAFAASESRLAQDDIRLRRSLMHSDGDGALAVLAALVDANPHWLSRASGVLATLRGSDLRRDWTSQACEAARLLAAELQVGEPVLCALDEVFERWDGTGIPHGRAIDGISLVARLAQVAHTAVLICLTAGVDAARARLTADSGKSLDPKIAQAARSMLAVLETSDFLVTRLERIGQTEAFAIKAPLSRVAASFGDFADLQSPFTGGHSRAVHSLCTSAARQLGTSTEMIAELGLAASLHDLGQVALPSSLWLRDRAWRPSEREQARTHAYHTERVLAAARPLARAAVIAGAHHAPRQSTTEPRRPTAVPLDLATRLLAAAEIACGMRQSRPHRPAYDTQATVAHMRALAAQRLLDGEAVEAIVAALGLRSRMLRKPSSELTGREYEVLRHLAVGGSNKHIAKLLGISARTVQTHTLNIYGKLGVNTRAGAALVAARGGLLDVYGEHPPFG